MTLFRDQEGKRKRLLFISSMRLFTSPLRSIHRGRQSVQEIACTLREGCSSQALLPAVIDVSPCLYTDLQLRQTLTAVKFLSVLSNGEI